MMNHRSRAGCCASLLVVACLARPALGQVPTVTLENAVRLAKQAQPAVVQARGSLRTADAQVRSARGAYLPSLTASSNGSRSYSETQRVGPTGELESGNTTTTSMSFGLSSSIDLFTGFRRGADNRSARATQDAAEAGVTNAEFQAELTVTQQFFDALAAQQLVRVREAGVRRAEEQLNLSAAKLRVGSATRSDSLRSLVNLGNAQLALVSAGSDVTRTQAALARSLGLDGRVAAEDDSAFYAPTMAIDTLELNREAMARSPRVQSTEANARAADASVKAARSQYFPSLALSGSANWSGNNNTDYQLFANRQLPARPVLADLQPVPAGADHRDPAVRARCGRGHGAGRPAGDPGGADHPVRGAGRGPGPDRRSAGPASRRRPRICGWSASATGWAPPRSWTCSPRRKRWPRRRWTW